ncbi:aminotransferase class I/II-fold pyridoxal phosphate-dependent enzyme [Cytobacillus firmus]|uniref:trans-sulfuration enzyme family protein n=1 Tax=Cytobacillus firmus TaxID=1399 RepID=UPI0024C1A10A|nr:aminotransferase class I/II-fold pyridoxal phosphate-dependent enzyme [Cytobacillus firmus]WHY35072.1 aminotransferase class I/II-fold pyridoxal phosphate-dependent enzyme [Cytobacillus firmus]
MNFETSVLHRKNNSNRKIKSKVTPIYQTSAFAFSDLDELEGFYQGNGNYLYSRVGNPNTDELGELIAGLEGAPAGTAASSGLSAILSGVLAVVKSGDHIVAADDLYGGSFHLIKEELTQLGIEVTFVSFSDAHQVEGAIKENTKLLYSESITNPLLRVEDLEEVVRLAKKHHLVTLIDNTFATPYHCKPYLKGIDLVVHSATKYIGGHSDITAGVLVGDEELVGKARGKIVNLGANLSPFEAWLTCRGVKTLALRMKQQSANARKVARALEQNQEVNKVYYPFHHGEEGFGAIVTIELSDTADVNKFFKELGWIKIVPTLAGVETSVSHPLTTSHRALPPEVCKELGITKQVVRISIGIEHADDIIAQLNEAVNRSL